MVDEVFGLAGITADVQLWVGGARARLNERVATVMRRFEDFHHRPRHDGQVERPRSETWRRRCPGGVLVHGDTRSAMAAALAAFHLRIPVMHVEAGLRSGAQPVAVPGGDEPRGDLVSRCMHFAPTEANQENLVRENISVNQIFVTGNTGIDALHWAGGARGADSRSAGRAGRRARSATRRRDRPPPRELGRRAGGIAEGVARVASAHPDVRFVVPVHPNPRGAARSSDRALEALDNVLLTEPLGYAAIARLLSRATSSSRTRAGSRRRRRR